MRLTEKTLCAGLARQQLEFFVVEQTQLDAGAQGRNRPIVLGQVREGAMRC